MTPEENGQKYHIMLEELGLETELSIACLVKLVADALQVKESSVWEEYVLFGHLLDKY